MKSIKRNDTKFVTKKEIRNGKHKTIQSRSRKHRFERVPDRENPPMRRLPHPTNGDQTSAVDLRSTPFMAQDLVAGLEGPSSEDLLLRCQGGIHA
jgi:hypothetical protein